MSDAENREQERKAQGDAFAMARWLTMLRRSGGGGHPLVPVLVRASGVIRDFPGEVNAFVIACEANRVHVALMEPIAGHRQRGALVYVPHDAVRVPEWFLDGSSA